MPLKEHFRSRVDDLGSDSEDKQARLSYRVHEVSPDLGWVFKPQMTCVKVGSSYLTQIIQLTKYPSRVCPVAWVFPKFRMESS